MLNVVGTRKFGKQITRFLNEDEIYALEYSLGMDPESGDIIPKTRNLLRKKRWSLPAKGKGKRGGLRIIYSFLRELNTILMMTSYSKNEKSDISRLELVLLMEELESWIKKLEGEKA